MKFSRFGRQFTQDSGTLQLMDDLGATLDDSERWLSLGGGNPSRIPAMEAEFRARLQALIQRPGAFEGLIGSYDGPGGDREFAAALATLLHSELGWPVSEENIAITNGSQSTFFFLFNLLGGVDEAGEPRRILFPLAPEYIGYGDLGIEPGMFSSARPEIELLDDFRFKYHVDFDALPLDDSVAAICVSRPTNPSGNVLTDNEMARLHELAVARDIPFIVDNAYGNPFPGIIFAEATPVWDESIIYCMSLSKLGLPGLRTGIVIAAPEITRALQALNAQCALAPGRMGPALVTDMLRSGEVLEFSRHLIRPHYETRALRAMAQLREGLAGYPARVHNPEGAIFLWAWFEDLPITNAELYERLKARKVIVVSGHYFFPGLPLPWQHKNECIRISYAQDPDMVREGLDIIIEEVRRAYDGGRGDALSRTDAEDV